MLELAAPTEGAPAPAEVECRRVDPATTIAIVSATLNLGAAGVLAAVSMAPGWRGTRTFAAIALTAGLYNITSAVFATGGLSTTTYLAAGRVSYALGHVQGLLWLLVAFGGPEASWRSMPRAVRLFSMASAAVALVVVVTGIHLMAIVDTIAIPWAGVEYHLPVTTVFGDVYGFLVVVQFAPTFFALLNRYRRGEQGLALQIGGFTLFFASTVLELAVANRMIEFLSTGDLGILCVVLPVSARVMSRFVADAERVNALSGQLGRERCATRRTGAGARRSCLSNRSAWPPSGAWPAASGTKSTTRSRT